MQEIISKDQKTIVLSETDLETVNRKQEIYLNLFKFCFKSFFDRQVQSTLGVTDIKCIYDISVTPSIIKIEITLDKPGLLIGVQSITLNNFINYCKQFFHEDLHAVDFKIEILESSLLKYKKDLIADYIKNRKKPTEIPFKMLMNRATPIFPFEFSTEQKLSDFDRGRTYIK